MSSNNTASGMGCLDSFLVLLQVLFIGLKLGGVVTWPWLWVMSPFVVVLAVVVLVILAVVSWAVISALIKDKVANDL